MRFLYHFSVRVLLATTLVLMIASTGVIGSHSIGIDLFHPEAIYARRARDSVGNGVQPTLEDGKGHDSLASSAIASFPFYDGFESGSLGDDWTIYVTNQGQVQVSSDHPYAGIYSLLLDDSVYDNTYSFAAAILSIDLSGQTEVELDFWWDEFNDEYHAADGVFISDDGGTSWEIALLLSDNPTTWRHQVLDLDAIAQDRGLTLNSQFQIKFQFYDDDYIPNDGFAIDEVRVRPPPVPTPASLPFYDGFETGALGESWITTFTKEGRVQVSSDHPYAGIYSLLLDDWEYDGIYSTAAAILAVDLSGQTEVELDFWWDEFNDEYHAEDGIFISDDGGTSWETALLLSDNPTTWRHQVLDLDTIAQDRGLTLNSQFQIKFQFYDDDYIPNDGFAIDEVRVRPPPVPTPASFPFYDGFESGSLGESWITTFTKEGRVQVSDAYAYAGTYSLLLDDWEYDGIYSTAAAILAVDLSGQSKVNLDFWWREFSDEYHVEDGVFISDDGGASWSRLLLLSDNASSWQHQVVDLAAAAQSKGLELNDQFRIKFQFYDDDYIPNDGFAFDEVQLRANIAPTLVWTGVSHYEQDGLHPESGDTGDNFAYRIKYSDADGDEPAFVRVHIEKGGQPIMDSPFAMNCEDGEYAEGVICSYSHAGLAAGEDYTYYFTAQDENGNNAAATPILDAPDVAQSSKAYMPLVIRLTPPPEAAPILDPISNPEGHYKFTLQWSAVEYASRYILEQDVLQTFTNPQVVYEGSRTSTEISVRQAGTYYYRVKAENPSGSSDWSNVESVNVTATPPSCPQAGAWAGTTDQGSPISFKVSDSPTCEVESLTIMVQLHYCAIVGNEIVLTKVFEGAEISDLQFEFDQQYYDIRCGINCREKVDGEFTSETEAKGSWYFYICNEASLFPGRFCFDSGSWTASYKP